VDHFVTLLLQIASAIASLVLLSIGLAVVFGRQPGALRVPDAGRLRRHYRLQSRRQSPRPRFSCHLGPGPRI